MNHVLFHLAFPVTDIAQTKEFYANGLGCQVGRETPAALILNLYGNQLVAHVTKEPLSPQQTIYPRHFGLIFTSEIDWEDLLERAQQHNLQFREEPKRRFIGQTTEHRTFFLEDPFYNLLEFKYYCHPEAIFGPNTLAAVGDSV
jgi:uncharacterized protein